MQGRRPAIVMISLSLLMALLVVTPRHAADQIAPDFTSMRKAAEAVIAKSKPGSALYQVDLSGRIDDRGPRFADGYFFYVRTANSRREGTLLHVITTANVDPSRVSETSYSLSSSDSLPKPLPTKVIEPEEALRRWDRPAPVLWRTTGVTLSLLQGGVEPLRRPLGPGREAGSFFKRTTDPNRWFWWALVGRSTANELVTIDAQTGAVSTRCAPLTFRRDSAPIPCPPAGFGESPGPRQRINR
jgi:hypothetical protein